MSRPPVCRIACIAALKSDPCGSMDAEQIAKKAGLTKRSVLDVMQDLRRDGVVPWVCRGRSILHFGSQEARDAYVRRHPTYAPLRKMDTGRVRCRSTLVQSITAALTDGPTIGMSAVDVHQAVPGLTAANARKLLAQMEAAGETWRYGPPHHLRWYATEAAMQAGMPLVDAAVVRRTQEVAAAKAKGGRVTARKGASTAWTKQPVAASVREMPAAQKSERQRASKLPPGPVEIIGIPDDRIERRPTPRGRYEPSPFHKGEFGNLGVGKYIA